MDNKCGKCSMDIANVKDGFKGVDCAASFHVVCSTESARKCGTRNKSTWKCDTCIAENSSSSSRAGDDRDGGQSIILKAIAAFRQEVNEKWTPKLSKLQEDLNTVTSDIGHLKIQLETTVEDSRKTNAKVEELKCENTRLNDIVVKLRSDVEDLQQHTRMNNIIISGVPFSKHENLSVILAHIAKLINVQLQWYDISAAHRLQQRSIEGNPPPLLYPSSQERLKMTGCWPENLPTV